MACQRFSALPSASSTLTGREIVPLTNASNVDQKTTTGAVAISATEYDATLTYTTGYQVLATDGNIYQALQNALGQTPQTSPTYWKLAYVLTSTTLSVPSVHATIIAAMTYLEGTVVTAALNIQVANGAYNYTTTQINLAHPYGRFISITGNTVTPASCSLSFSALPSPPSSPYLNSNSGSIYANAPSNVTINGFSILKSGGAPAFGHCGILASNGASINVGANMIVNGFYGDVAALNEGVITASSGLSLTTVASAYGIISDNGIIQAPGVAIAGPGDGISLRRGGFVRANTCTIDAAIGIAFVLESGDLRVENSTVGNVDTFYEVAGNSNLIQDGGTTFGTAGVYEIGLTGMMVYNGATVSADTKTFARALIEPNTTQNVTDPGESVFLGTTGIDTIVRDLVLSADANGGVIIRGADGSAEIPVSLTVGATRALTGMDSDTAVLDAAGLAVIPAAWITANTVIVCSSGSPSITGTLFSEAGDITPGVSFEIESTAGAADAGVIVHWVAFVYP